MVYQQIKSYDFENLPSYKEIIRFDFECKLMRFSEGLIHLHLLMVQEHDKTKGKFISTDTSPNKKLSETDENLQTLLFKRGSIHHQDFEIKFNHKHLDGLKTKVNMLHNSQSSDKTAYNGWNFTNEEMYEGLEDGFLFSPNTTLLLKSK